MSNNSKLVATVAAASIGLVVVYNLYRVFTKKIKSDDKKESKETIIKKNSILKLPVIEISAHFNKSIDPETYANECKKVADALHKYGVAIVRDPRVDEKDNNTFLDMLERYFEQSDGVRDARPEYHYQVGVTPSHIERPRDQCHLMGAYTPDNKPLSPCPPELDPKWRFFWRIGPTPKTTRFPSLNMDPVLPPEFPEWKQVMDMWGGKMLDAVTSFSEMAAVGFNLPSDAFTSRLQYGPHLLAPTGSNFNKFNEEGTVLAGYHYDLNFLTIHGKSRFPGLFIWTRDGTRTGLVIPDGCLLIQAGKQIEYLTGGHILAGFHEVVVTPGTTTAINRQRSANKSLWRVSSTLFSHIQSDQELGPLAHFATPESLAQFTPILTGDMVRKELQAIALDKSQEITPSKNPGLSG